MRNVKLRNISANYSSSPQDFEAKYIKKTRQESASLKKTKKQDLKW